MSFHELDFNGDLCGPLLLLAVLVGVGGKVVAESPACRRWGVRLAGIVLLASVASGLLSRQHDEPQLLALRALFHAGLVLGASWILLPLIGFFVHHTIVAPWRAVRRFGREVGIASAARKARLLEERQRKLADADYLRRAPERERARLEAEALARSRAEAQRRREDARASCQILYALHGPDIVRRFGKETFEEFVRGHMGDDRSPEYVEQRAAQLRELIAQHLEKAGIAQKRPTLASLGLWFFNEKEQIEGSPLGDEDKANLLAHLEERYARLQEKYIRAMRP
jgi:hypothetical protein